VVEIIGMPPLDTGALGAAVAKAVKLNPAPEYTGVLRDPEGGEVLAVAGGERASSGVRLVVQTNEEPTGFNWGPLS
jgi:hypothetical protein